MLLIVCENGSILFIKKKRLKKKLLWVFSIENLWEMLFYGMLVKTLRLLRTFPGKDYFESFSSKNTSSWLLSFVKLFTTVILWTVAEEQGCSVFRKFLYNIFSPDSVKNTGVSERTLKNFQKLERKKMVPWKINWLPGKCNVCWMWIDHVLVVLVICTLYFFLSFICFCFMLIEAVNVRLNLSFIVTWLWQVWLTTSSRDFSNIA